MGWWERNVIPWMVEKGLGTDEVRELRSETCRPLDGRVLEVGFGSGLNVAHYPAAVTEVVAVEPNDKAWRLAQPRIEQGTVSVTRSGRDGQRLSEPDDSFDHVLFTFVLCTIPDHRAALSEARRVLRPGGTLHFVEHGLAPEPAVQTWQHRLDPLQKRLGGCVLTRQHLDDLRATGWTLDRAERFYAAGPALSRPWAHIYRGTAHAR